MASIVEIGSNALRLLGADPITSLNDNNNRARLVAALWGSTRDFVLRDHDWNFARRRAALQASMATPLFDFAFAYPLPTDPWCLIVRRTNLDDSDTKWRIEGRDLLSSAPAVKIAYTARIEDSGLYDAGFENATTARLAYRLAYPITKSSTAAKEMLDLYRQELLDAKHQDSVESSPEVVTSDDLIVIRDRQPRG